MYGKWLSLPDAAQGTKAVDPVKLGMSFFALFSVSFFVFCKMMYMLCKPGLLNKDYL